MLPRARKNQPITADNYNKLVDKVEALEREIRSITPRPSPEIGHRRSAGGTTSFIKKNSSGGSSNVPTVCLLGGLESGESEGTKKITGGIVSTGGHSLAVESPDLTPAVNRKVYIKCNVTASVSDGVLFNNVGSFNSVEVLVGTEVPESSVLTVSAPTGSVYYELGRWVAGKESDSPPRWLPSGCGAIAFSINQGRVLFIRHGNPYLIGEHPAGALEELEF